MTTKRKEILCVDKTVKLLASDSAHERIHSSEGRYGKKKLESLIRQAYQYGYAAGKKEVEENNVSSDFYEIFGFNKNK